MAVSQHDSRSPESRAKTVLNNRARKDRQACNTHGVKAVLALHKSRYLVALTTQLIQSGVRDLNRFACLRCNETRQFQQSGQAAE